MTKHQMKIWTSFSSTRTTLAWPPSLAENDMLGLGGKAELLRFLKPVANVQTLNTTDEDVFDVAVLVRTLNPKTATTNVKIFKHCAVCVFIPHLKRPFVHVA